MRVERSAFAPAKHFKAHARAAVRNESERVSHTSRRIEQLDRAFDGRGTEMHVPRRVVGRSD